MLLLQGTWLPTQLLAMSIYLSPIVPWRGLCMCKPLAV